MKKILFVILLLLFNLNFCCAENVDGDYRKSILNKGYPYNVSGFFYAIQKNDKEIVEMFLLAGMNPDITLNGSPAPMHALFVGKIEMLEILLKHGADPETRVPALWVAIKPQNLLSFAIKRKNEEAVKSLIYYNVDVNKCFCGKSPLNYALKTGQLSIVEILLKAGAKPDDKTFKMIEKSKSEKIKKMFEEFN